MPFARKDSAFAVVRVPSAFYDVILGKEGKSLRKTEKATGTKISVEKGSDDNGRMKLVICGTTESEVEVAEDSILKQLAVTMERSHSIHSKAVWDFVQNWKRSERIKFEKRTETSIIAVTTSKKDAFILLKGWDKKSVSSAKKRLNKLAEAAFRDLPNIIDGQFTTVLEVRANVLSSKSSGRKLKEIEDDTDSSIERVPGPFRGKKGERTRFTVRSEELHDMQDAVKQLNSLLSHYKVKVICDDDAASLGGEPRINGSRSVSRISSSGLLSTDSDDNSSDLSVEGPDPSAKGPEEIAVEPEHEPDHKKYPKMMNILVLGETGVGKSTFINGLVNYLKFESLEEALEGGVQILIKSSFALTDENFHSQDIVTEPTFDDGKSSNEVFGKGQSATQDPKSYVFHWGEPGEEKSIRIIDTPGIGDTRGLIQDKENFEKILSFIADFDEIHAICVLLKSNASRLTVAFRFCIDELLVHLHKSASQNILFCFTNTRGTLYKPGDTLGTLREHLDKLQEQRGIDIPLDKSTLFSFDNEAFRFLCACKSDFKFTDHDKDNFTGSWTKSVDESLRLFRRVSELPVHKVNDTLCLNNTRSIILTLARPLAEIARNQMINMRLIEEKMKEVEERKNEGTNLKASLYVDRVILKSEDLSHPQTVCTAESCVTHERVGTDENSSMQTIYSTVCHAQCGVRGVQVENCPNTRLQKCSKMHRETLTCIICGCLWSTHMHIRYRIVQEMKKVIDPDVLRSIKNKDDSVHTIELFLAKEREKVDQLKAESEKISSHCAEFAAFLSANSIIPYNDSYRQYIEHLIKEERDKVGAGDNENMLIQLEKYKREYEQQVRLLDDSLKQQVKKHRSVEDMDELIKELHTLQHCGAILADIKKLEMKSVRQTQLNTDRMVPISGGWFSGATKTISKVTNRILRRK